MSSAKLAAILSREDELTTQSDRILPPIHKEVSHK